MSMKVEGDDTIDLNTNHEIIYKLFLDSDKSEAVFRVFLRSVGKGNERRVCQLQCTIYFMLAVCCPMQMKRGDVLFEHDPLLIHGRTKLRGQLDIDERAVKRVMNNPQTSAVERVNLLNEYLKGISIDCQLDFTVQLTDFVRTFDDLNRYLATICAGGGSVEIQIQGKVQGKSKFKFDLDGNQETQIRRMNVFCGFLRLLESPIGSYEIPFGSDSVFTFGGISKLFYGTANTEGRIHSEFFKVVRPGIRPLDGTKCIIGTDMALRNVLITLREYTEGCMPRTLKLARTPPELSSDLQLILLLGRKLWLRVEEVEYVDEPNWVNWLYPDELDSEHSEKLRFRAGIVFYLISSLYSLSPAVKSLMLGTRVILPEDSLFPDRTSETLKENILKFCQFINSGDSKCDATVVRRLLIPRFLQRGAQSIGTFWNNIEKDQRVLEWLYNDTLPRIIRKAKKMTEEQVRLDRLDDIWNSLGPMINKRSRSP